MLATTWKMGSEFLGDGSQYEDSSLIGRLGYMPKMLHPAASLLFHETKEWSDYLEANSDCFESGDALLKTVLNHRELPYEAYRLQRDAALAKLPDAETTMYLLKYLYVVSFIEKAKGEVGDLLRDFWGKLCRLSLEDVYVRDIPVGDDKLDAISWDQLAIFAKSLGVEDGRIRSAA